jgi:hypothetical protein
VAAGVRVLGAKGRPEGVDLGQRQAIRLDVELPGCLSVTATKVVHLGNPVGLAEIAGVRGNARASSRGCNKRTGNCYDRCGHRWVCGGIATLLWNGFMSRRADYRKTVMEKTSEEADRQHERAVLRVALHAELRSLSRSVRREIKFIEGHVEFSWVPIIDFFRVHLTNLNKLGLLRPAEVEWRIEQLPKLKGNSLVISNSPCRRPIWAA